jgi:hypothetical protein
MQNAAAHHIPEETTSIPGSWVGAKSDSLLATPDTDNFREGAKQKEEINASQKLPGSWGAGRLQNYSSILFHLKVKLVIFILYLHMSLLERQMLLRRRN